MIGVRDAFEGTVFGIWRSIESWRKGKADRQAEANRREILEDLLSGPWEWRSTDVLCKAIDADRQTAGNLLLAIGAIRATDGRDMWHFPPEKRREIRRQRARRSAGT